VDEPGCERTSWRRDSDLNKPANTTIRVQLGLRLDEIRTAWEDRDIGADRMEDHLSDIVVGVTVAGEVAYRLREISHHTWQAQRKAQLLEERRQQAEELEQRERERQAAEQKARIDGLLTDAEDHRRANNIRQCVEAVRRAASKSVVDVRGSAPVVVRMGARAGRSAGPYRLWAHRTRCLRAPLLDGSATEPDDGWCSRVERHAARGSLSQPAQRLSGYHVKQHGD
jgi:hypothetical protein